MDAVSPLSEVSLPDRGLAGPGCVMSVGVRAISKSVFAVTDRVEVPQADPLCDSARRDSALPNSEPHPSDENGRPLRIVASPDGASHGDPPGSAARRLPFACQEQRNDSGSSANSGTRSRWRTTFSRVPQTESRHERGQIVPSRIFVEQTLDVLVCDATGPLNQRPGRVAIAAYCEVDPARERLPRAAEVHGNVAAEESVHEWIASCEHQLVIGVTSHIQ